MDGLMKDIFSLLSAFEERLIVRALKRHDSNRAQAAKSLGIARTTLVMKMQKLGLDRKFPVKQERKK